MLIKDEDISLKILIVDDNDNIREELSSYLNRYGISTIEASNAREARDVLAHETISLAILDVIMPGESGFELTKWITANTNVPVILLTSLDEVVDKVIGLEIGADDYIPKPFDPRELLARAKAVIRRHTSGNEAIGEIKLNTDVEADIAATGHLLFSDGRIEKIRDTETRLLQILTQKVGQCVTRESLYEDVLGRTWDPTDRTIDNMIARIRKLIEKNPSQPNIIRTVRQRGYVLTKGFFYEGKNTVDQHKP